MPETTTLKSTDIFKLEASVERLGGLVAATAAHMDRTGDRELGDMMRLGLEDVRMMRELLIEKGAIRRQVSMPNDIAISAVRDTLRSIDPLPASFHTADAEAP